MEFLLFNEVLKNLIIFQIPIKTFGFIMLMLSKFRILNANMWSIYSKFWIYGLHLYLYVLKNIFFPTSEAL